MNQEDKLYCQSEYCSTQPINTCILDPDHQTSVDRNNSYDARAEDDTEAGAEISLAHTHGVHHSLFSTSVMNTKFSSLILDQVVIIR